MTSTWLHRPAIKVWPPNFYEWFQILTTPELWCRLCSPSLHTNPTPTWSPCRNSYTSWSQSAACNPTTQYTGPISKLMTSLTKVKFSFPIGSHNRTAADKKHPYMVVNMRESSTKCILFFPMKDGCKPKNLCCGWPSYDHQEPLISATIHRHIIAK